MTASGFDISFGLAEGELNDTYGKFYMNWIERTRSASDLKARNKTTIPLELKPCKESWSSYTKLQTA
jgi:hypothetical protein